LAVFDQLERLAQHTDDGIAWYSGPELLPEWQRENCPNGYYNLGVAHGIPGIIHFLSEVSAREIVPQDRVRRLLEGSGEWLIAHARPAGSQSRFSSWFVPGQESADGRMARCYGDIGLGVLRQVAQRSDRSDWLQFTNDLLDHCLAWPPEKTGVADAPRSVAWEPNPAFLDGASGIALALLSAVTPVEPGWDRMLLLSGKNPAALPQAA
jgi:hypothetical protein